MSGVFRALIVDDEPLARRRVRDLLAPHGDITIAGECASGTQAIADIRRLMPDLVFLDIQMPEVDGLQVVREIGPMLMPALIFTTAFDQHALKAFELHAIDYLLKPFDAERFDDALRNARARLARHMPVEPSLERRLTELLRTMEHSSRPPESLVIRSDGRMIVIPLSELEWVEAEGKHVRLHCGSSSHVARQSMKEVEASLDPARFVRIHRSTLVNISAVRELQPIFNGDHAVILKSGTELTLSRTYRQQVCERLGLTL